LKNKPKIYFRADGNSEIGLGHVMRSLALVEMVKDHFHCTFLIRDPSASIKAKINTVCDEIAPLNSSLDLISEAKMILEQWVEEGLIIVLDGYGFDTEYQKVLKSGNVKVVSIDDINAYHFVSDAVINHAPGVSRERYLLEDNTQFLGGLDYALIHPMFLDVAKRPRRISSISKLFICFGGADSFDLTNKVLLQLLDNLPQEIKEITVVVGASYQNVNQLKTTIDKFTKTEIRLLVNLSAKEMLGAMIRSDIAILPSSTILYEAISVKMPIISGYYVKNQESVYHGFKDLELIYGVGNLTEIKDYVTPLQEVISSDWNKVIRSQANSIDGLSSMRIRNLVMVLSNAYQMRAATFDDTEILFAWANDPAVRNNAISTSDIALENHIDWFKAKLESEESYIFIFEYLEKPIGQVRFDLNEKEATIDYSIDKNQRKKGFGKLILEFGMQKLREVLNDEVTFLAYVKLANLPSIRVFESLGFHKKENVIIKKENYTVFEA